MKPLKLYLQNIGPYISEKIDFEELDNMFLITGNTGSGKTFIFDSIVYALYGRLSTSRTFLQSDFTSKENESTIELIFSVAEKKYRIKRILSHQYVNKFNRISEKEESATFEIFNPNTNNFEQYDRNQNVQAVNGYAEKVIGLKYSEFSKIVVLPQGEFAQFLKQNSSEKSITLGKLFPVSDFKEITQKVKDLATETRNKLTLLDRQIIELKENLNLSEIDNTLSAKKESIRELTKKITENEKCLIKLSEKNQTLINSKELAIQYEKNKNELVNIQNEENEYLQISSQIQKATKALNLYSSYNAKQNSLKECLRLSNKLNIIEENEKLVLEKLSTNEEEKESIEKLKNLVEENKEKIIEFKRKIEIAKIIEELKNKEINLSEKSNKIKNNISSCESSISLINQELLQITKSFSTDFQNQNIEINEKILIILNNKKNEILSDLQNVNINIQKNLEYNELLKKINETQQSLLEEKEKQTKNKTLKDNLQKIKEENIAFYLSEKLISGEKCPVCGSTNHPHPATKNTLTFEQKDKTLDQAIIEAENSVQTIGQLISSLETKIDENTSLLQKFVTEKNHDDLSLEKEKIVNNLDYINKKIDSSNKLLEQLKNKSKEKEQIQKTEDEIEDELKEVKTQISTNLNNFIDGEIVKSSELSITLKKIETNNLENTSKIEKWINDNKELQEKKISILTQKDETITEKQLYDNESKKNIEIFSNLLKESIFSTEEELECSLLSETEIKEKQIKYDKWNNKKTEIEGYLKKTKYEKSSDEINIEINKINIELKSITDKLSIEKSDLDIIKDEYNKLNNGYLELNKKIKEKEDFEKDNEALFKLNDDLSGKNQINTTFETWALATYFEDVISYANNRLYDMSKGRYTFLLGKGKDNRGQKGLDVSVLDSYTGKIRDSSSFSGGELFIASLSLALGLTDAVTNRNGGIQLDSLFIDEGFGTLDFDTQEITIDTLLQLQENKMVGIISHIEFLKNAVHSQIYVEKTTSGSKIHIKS
jgi:DNA repair protein SbcC/Rad50